MLRGGSFLIAPRFLRGAARIPDLFSADPTDGFGLLVVWAVNEQEK